MALFRLVADEHVVLRVAALPDGAVELEGPPVDDGQVVGVGDEDVRHVRGVLEGMRLDALGGHISGHVVADTLDPQASVPGLHVKLVLPLGEVVRLHAVVGPDLGGSIFIELAEGAPAHGPHPAR